MPYVSIKGVVSNSDSLYGCCPECNCYVENNYRVCPSCKSILTFQSFESYKNSKVEKKST
jgi:hypothetical protein